MECKTKNITSLGYEKAEGIWNNPSISGKHMPNKIGYAPTNRDEVCATVLEKGVLYFLGEDDEHYAEKGVLTLSVVKELVRDLQKLIDDPTNFTKHNLWSRIRREETGNLIHINMGSFFVSYHIHWASSILKVLTNSQRILNDQ